MTNQKIFGGYLSIRAAAQRTPDKVLLGVVQNENMPGWRTLPSHDLGMYGLNPCARDATGAGMCQSAIQVVLFLASALLMYMIGNVAE
jgi:hypothetical protein